MYTPESFQVTDLHRIHEFIKSNPFALLIGDQQQISHIPIHPGQDDSLYGHLAAANPQTQTPSGSTVTAVFTGPHAYISPRYYTSDFNVPTWNYSAVHATGTLTFIDDDHLSWELMNRMVLDSEGPDGWKLPDEPNFRQLLRGIKVFEITNVTFQATFKYNQNKNSNDQASVLEHLKARNPEAADFMQRLQDSQS